MALTEVIMTNVEFARRLAIIASRASNRAFDSLILLDKAHDEVSPLLVGRTCADLKMLVDNLIEDTTIKDKGESSEP